MLLRASIGRHREEQQLQVDDEELVARSRADLRDAVGLTAEPVDAVQRWGGGLPQYAVGHLDRVRRIRDHVGAVPGLAVCGAAYDGLGIPACIASAEDAARQVLDGLPPADHPAAGRAPTTRDNGAMTDSTDRADAQPRQDRQGPQRLHPLHDVVGVPPAGRRWGTPTARRRRARSTSSSTR